MWTWIVTTLGLAGNVVPDTIRRWVGDLISGVFGFVHTIFGFVGHAWVDLYRAAVWLYTGVIHLAIETYADLYHILKIVIPGVLRWANKFIHDVWRYAIDVFHWTIRQIDFLKHWILWLIDHLRAWVIRNVWDPIWHTLYPVWQWVIHEGAALWHLVTHPALLVDWIWNHLLVKIEREAWTAGRLLGRFFLSLIVHNIRTFAILIEDIVDAIL